MATTDARPAAPGVVELREDAPLKVSGGGGGGGAPGGVRALVACFAALSAGVTVALLAQIWSGSAAVGLHGAAAAGACSAAAGAVLRARGSAVDAAAAAALCLAVAQPDRLNLNSSGALLYWEYRTKHGSPPQVAEWGEAVSVLEADGAVGAGGAAPPGGSGPPRLLAALAALHARYGLLPWSEVLQPALSLALSGAASDGTPPRGAALAAVLGIVQHNTSAELWSKWSAWVRLREGPAPAQPVAGGWTLYAGGGGAARAASLLQPVPADDPQDSFIASVVRRMWASGAARGTRGASAALADTRGAYASLVAGDADSEEPGAPAPLDLTAAMLVDGAVCGSRYVLGSSESGALAQVAAQLTTGAAPAVAVESARVAVRAGTTAPQLLLEAGRGQPPPTPPGAPPALAPGALAAVAVLRQAGDALASHADSRAGGLAARF